MYKIVDPQGGQDSQNLFHLKSCGIATNTLEFYYEESINDCWQKIELRESNKNMDISKSGYISKLGNVNAFIFVIPKVSKRSQEVRDRLVGCFRSQKTVNKVFAFFKKERIEVCLWLMNKGNDKDNIVVMKKVNLFSADELLYNEQTPTFLKGLSSVKSSESEMRIDTE